jgi:hypothetical protein
MFSSARYVLVGSVCFYDLEECFLVLLDMFLVGSVCFSDLEECILVCCIIF